jgi:hypothetical protein
LRALTCVRKVFSANHRNAMGWKAEATLLPTLHIVNMKHEIERREGGYHGGTTTCIASTASIQTDAKQGYENCPRVGDLWCGGSTSRTVRRGIGENGWSKRL